MEDLDDHIIEIFSWAEPGTKLRWFEIRNELLRDEKVNPNFVLTKDSSSFNVKVSRALKRLEKQDILEAYEEGHKNISYSLSKKATEKLLRKASSSISKSITGFGLFSPDDFLNLSYEQFKRRLLKTYEKMFDDEWKAAYEEGRKYVLGKKKEGVKP